MKKLLKEIKSGSNMSASPFGLAFFVSRRGRIIRASFFDKSIGVKHIEKRKEDECEQDQAMVAVDRAR